MRLLAASKQHGFFRGRQRQATPAGRHAVAPRSTELKRRASNSTSAGSIAARPSPLVLFPAPFRKILGGAICGAWSPVQSSDQTERLPPAARLRMQSVGCHADRFGIALRPLWVGVSGNSGALLARVPSACGGLSRVFRGRATNAWTSTESLIPVAKIRLGRSVSAVAPDRVRGQSYAGVVPDPFRNRRLV